MKRTGILLALFLVFSLKTLAQEKKITRTGKIVFEASIPAFEEIKAKNETVTCVLNTTTGEIASLVLMKGFRFKVALMEEHFNESYVESDKYPKATLKGTIQGFNANIIGTTPKEFKIKGVLEMHGKSKEINTTAMIKKVGDGFEIISNFDINTDDFNIEIPKVIVKKISKKVTIKTDFLLK
ncbi:YceI family protein [Flavobacterium sp.]|uniref:YceI family protein n=1 Tax=Flavobacterium sp. TaxID=239 RepID=UPI00286C9FC5|nr:YceI family protein [Flavobacterium sp.]